MLRLLKRLFQFSGRTSVLDHKVAKAAREVGRLRDDFMVERPGVARDMLVALAIDHASELKRGKRFPESIVWQQFAYTLSGKDILDDVKDMEPERQLDFAAEIFATGDLELSTRLYEFLLTEHPDNHDVATSLAALYNKAGEQEKADRFLDDFFSAHPFFLEKASLDAVDAKRLVIVAGNDKSRYKIGGNGPGSHYTYRSGGHFMLTHLLDEKNHNLVRFTVAAENVSRLADVGPHDLMINTVADADREYQSLKSLEAYLQARQQEIPVINHPSKVLETTRDNNYRRLNDLEGFVFPRTERVLMEARSANVLADQIEGLNFSYPVIVRETGTHTAVTTELVSDRAALEVYLEKVTGDCLYVIQFEENASPEGHYSKLRFFSIDGRLYPVVHHIDQVWNVHGSNRKTFMAANPWMLEQERQFLNDPPSIIGHEIYERLQTLPEKIGLEFFGFDFTILPDDRVLIFELNPAMRHSFTHGKNFPYMMPYLQNITDAFQAMVRRRAAKG